MKVFINGEQTQSLRDLIPSDTLLQAQKDEQKALPSFAKNPLLTQKIEEIIRKIPTQHNLILGDCRTVDDIKPESVHLVVTSPPYWTLKTYPKRNGQLGLVEDYTNFLDELDKIWKKVFDLLVPGGRLVIVVGDICLPRRKFGRHVVFPLHASIQERCRLLGFDNLAPIIWHKISNADYESDNGGTFLGKPYEPNSIVKNDIEYILFQRKSGGYRQPSLDARILSVIPETQHKEWFQQIWTLPGSSTRQHPAPFSPALAERLIRMFSFVGDTVLDPFMGTGTTNLAASKWGRNSIGIEIEPEYFEMAVNRLKRYEGHQLRMSTD